MRRTRGCTVLRASALALGLAASAAGVARADKISGDGGSDSNPTLLAFDTVGSSINTAVGVTGDPTALSLVPVAGGSFLSPSSLSLGAFQAKGLAAGQSTTFTNTPFDIKFTADAVGGQAVQPNQTPINITGVLNGTLSGPDQSNVTATFDKPAATPLLDASVDPTKVATYPFMTGLYTNTLTVPDNPLTVVPSTTGGGMTTAQAVLNNSAITSPVPEPTSVVLFAATAAGLVFRHRLRRDRDRSAD